MTFASNRRQANEAAERAADQVHVDVEPRRDIADGMFEITVTVDHEKKGSTLVLTSPRSFAFRKAG